MKKISAKSICMAGIIAALYVVLTTIATALGLSSGAIQVRFSEALCILACFTPYAIPGLFIGCIISNVLAGAIIWDVVFGSIATLIGGIGTYLLRKNRYLAAIPPIVANMIIVPLVLIYAYHLEDAFWFLVVTVGIGEVISIGILGELLYTLIKRNHKVFDELFK